MPLCCVCLPRPSPGTDTPVGLPFQRHPSPFSNIKDAFERSNLQRGCVFHVICGAWAWPFSGAPDLKRLTHLAGVGARRCRSHNGEGQRGPFCVDSVRRLKYCERGITQQMAIVCLFAYFVQSVCQMQIESTCQLRPAPTAPPRPPPLPPVPAILLLELCEHTQASKQTATKRHDGCCAAPVRLRSAEPQTKHACWCSVDPLCRCARRERNNCHPFSFSPASV